MPTDNNSVVLTTTTVAIKNAKTESEVVECECASVVGVVVVITSFGDKILYIEDTLS